ncbi:MAG: hypothetical protein NVSMB13_02610 [Mycobacteriales bacterium]
MVVYTLGVWTVRAGQEEQFVAAWQDMASKTAAEFPGASGILLRDRDQPERFISSGPWDSLELIEQWRASSTFREGVARIRPLVEVFEPHTMDPAAAVGSP